MLRYDEARILGPLAFLPPRARVVFALLVAYRLLPAYRRFHEQTGGGDASALEALTERLWLDLTGYPMSGDELRDAAALAVELVPEEDDDHPWDVAMGQADDAAAAVTYAFRTRQDGAPQSAASAAERAIETLLNYADDADLDGDALVHAEVTRQLRDLEDLVRLDGPGKLDSELPALRERSRREAGELFNER